MREFFRGWRRKVGVVTLALALWCAWVRSCVCRDSFDLFSADSLTAGSCRYWIQSHDGGIEYWKSEEVSLESLRKKFEKARDVNQEDELPLLFIHSGPLPWEDTLLWRVPYWSLTLPLTLLPAYLLLRPQRKRTSRSQPND